MTSHPRHPRGSAAICYEFSADPTTEQIMEFGLLIEQALADMGCPVRLAKMWRRPDDGTHWVCVTVKEPRLKDAVRLLAAHVKELQAEVRP